MRNEPILETLSITDLNQRYNHSFLHYDGKIVSCGGFESKEGTIRIRIVKSDGLYLEKFEPKKLNVYRPEAKWIAVRGRMDAVKEVPIFFSYRPARQWSRGFNADTCHLFSPIPSMVGLNKRVLDKVFETPFASPKVTYKALWDEVKVCDWKILSPTMCVAKTGKMRYELFFRSSPIATLGKEGLKISQPHFEQEIAESIIR
jgi:hypothetical protein